MAENFHMILHFADKISSLVPELLCMFSEATLVSLTDCDCWEIHFLTY